jgi:chromate transporter
MAARGGSVLTQVLGALAGGIGIFLPGLLLIFFIYPIWENLKKIKGIKVSLKGINAVAGGLIAVAAVILMQKSGLVIDNIIVTLITMGLLISKKIPAPIIVVLSIIAGFII